jgi:hypothetical protein
MRLSADKEIGDGLRWALFLIPDDPPNLDMRWLNGKQTGSHPQLLDHSGSPCSLADLDRRGKVQTDQRREYYSRLIDAATSSLPSGRMLRGSMQCARLPECGRHA